MKRSNTVSLPDAIFTSDWHLREDQPIARTDNFWETLWKKVGFIRRLQEKYSCPILHPGDLFDKWKVSPYLLTETTKNLPKQFITIYGNHDLPRHSLALEMVEKTSVYNLWVNHVVGLHEGGIHWGAPLPQEIAKEVPYFEIKGRKIVMWHIMATKKKLPFMPEALTSEDLVALFPEADVVLTGHNHKTFYKKVGKQLHVNPGAIFRTHADEQDHQPTIYLYYAATNIVKPVPLPIQQNVLTREHIDNKEERDQRLSAFISRLHSGKAITMNFEQNLERYLESNKISKDIQDIVYECVQV